MKHHFENLQDRFKKKQIQEEKQKQEKNARESMQRRKEIADMRRKYLKDTTDTLIVVWYVETKNTCRFITKTKTDATMISRISSKSVLIAISKCTNEKKRETLCQEFITKQNKWIKNKQSRCWRKAVCWETNILNATSLISASSIFLNITHSTRQIVWLRYMKHLKNERMFSLSDSDEVQKQRLHRCSFHDVSHTRKREILCDTHRQSTMQKKIWLILRTVSFETLIDEKDSCVIIETYTTQNMQSDDDRRKSSVLINSSQRMIAMSERWVCEHHRDEKTIQHQIENSDQTYWYLMM